MVHTRVSVSFCSRWWFLADMHVAYTGITGLSKASFLCGRNFCKSSWDTVISCPFSLLFCWLFPCPMSQSWIVWLQNAHLFSSAMTSKANFSVKNFFFEVCEFAEVHVSYYGLTCPEPFLSKGFQQSKLRVKQRFQAQVLITKNCWQFLQRERGFTQIAILIFNYSLVSYVFSWIQYCGHPLFPFLNSPLVLPLPWLSIQHGTWEVGFFSLSFHSIKHHLVLWQPQTFWRQKQYTMQLW